MLERIRQGLLHDAIRREVDRGREPDGLALDVQAHGQAGPLDLCRERVEALEARLRGQLGVRALTAHGAEEPSHLGEGRAARLLDAAQRVLLLGELPGQLVPDGAHLEHHHADRVGDDVVQLACDPRPLLGDGHAGCRFALPLRLARAHLRGLGLLDPRLEREPRQPADPEQERDEDDLAGGVARLVVDDERRTADGDRRGRAGLHGVAQVPEEERRDHPADEDARHERDQAPVDERQRHPEQPEGRGRAEWKAPPRQEREHRDDGRRDDEPVRRLRRAPARRAGG